MNLTKEFLKFVGKEVREGNNPAGYAFNDSVMKDIFDLAAKKGLTVRTILPGQAVTRDMRRNRLNVYLDVVPTNNPGRAAQLKVKSFNIG